MLPRGDKPLGTEPSKQVSALAFGRVVTVHPKDVDRYGRIVARVVLPDGRSLNEALVRGGWAWWFRRYAPNDARLRALETEAREARRGLWADPSPVPPWEWRAARRAVPSGRAPSKVLKAPTTVVEARAAGYRRKSSGSWRVLPLAGFVGTFAIPHPGSA